LILETNLNVALPRYPLTVTAAIPVFGFGVAVGEASPGGSGSLGPPLRGVGVGAGVCAIVGAAVAVSVAEGIGVAVGGEPFVSCTLAEVPSLERYDIEIAPDV
jgi:hypothetical protein